MYVCVCFRVPSKQRQWNMWTSMFRGMRGCQFYWTGWFICTAILKKKFLCPPYACTQACKKTQATLSHPANHTHTHSHTRTHTRTPHHFCVHGTYIDVTFALWHVGNNKKCQCYFQVEIQRSQGVPCHQQRLHLHQCQWGRQTRGGGRERQKIHLISFMFLF